MTTAVTLPVSPPPLTLFRPSIEEELLRSVHQLGKPTITPLWRLFRTHPEVGGAGKQPKQTIRNVLSGLTKNRSLIAIQPIDIEHPNLRNLPRVYRDTDRSRKRVSTLFDVPVRTVPDVPSPDWRFLFHDATLSDDLVSFELTARLLGPAFGYQTHFGFNNENFYPRLTITDGTLTHSIRPKPDKTLIIGDYHVPYEYDCGTEQVALGNIIRDSSVARKFLVTEVLEQSGRLDELGWRPRLYPMVVNGEKRTRTSSRKRIATIIEEMPNTVDPTRFYFVDRQTHQAAGDDVSGVTWLRGDGQAMPLPCWRDGSRVVATVSTISISSSLL